MMKKKKKQRESESRTDVYKLWAVFCTFTDKIRNVHCTTYCILHKQGARINWWYDIMETIIIIPENFGTFSNVSKMMWKTKAHNTKSFCDHESDFPSEIMVELQEIVLFECFERLKILRTHAVENLRSDHFVDRIHPNDFSSLITLRLYLADSRFESKEKNERYWLTNPKDWKVWKATKLALNAYQTIKLNC